MAKWWYYLHGKTGHLIPTRTKRVVEMGEEIIASWEIDSQYRFRSWVMLVEALAMGADKTRVFELAKLWEMTNEDAQRFVERAGLRVFRDGESWCATQENFDNLQNSPAGFGETALEALSMLAKVANLIGRIEGDAYYEDDRVNKGASFTRMRTRELLQKGMRPEDIEK